MGDGRIEIILSVMLQRRQRTGFITGHQARIADHISRKDGGKPPIGGFIIHWQWS
jgi:hypothetical protein